MLNFTELVDLAIVLLVELHVSIFINLLDLHFRLRVCFLILDSRRFQYLVALCHVV